jgi:hypothetical protein
LDGVVKANPSLASTYIAGQTYEKRNISVLVIKTPTKPPSVKSSVWIDCGIHAVNKRFSLFENIHYF